MLRSLEARHGRISPRPFRVLLKILRLQSYPDFDVRRINLSLEPRCDHASGPQFWNPTLPSPDSEPSSPPHLHELLDAWHCTPDAQKCDTDGCELDHGHLENDKGFTLLHGFTISSSADEGLHEASQFISYLGPSTRTLAYLNAILPPSFCTIILSLTPKGLLHGTSGSR